jgi:hypothetical protein
MVIGYIPVSKCDGSQMVAPQRHTLLAAWILGFRIPVDRRNSGPVREPVRVASRSGAGAGHRVGTIWSYNLQSQLVRPTRTLPKDIELCVAGGPSVRLIGNLLDI